MKGEKETIIPMNQWVRELQKKSRFPSDELSRLIMTDNPIILELCKEIWGNDIKKYRSKEGREKSMEFFYLSPKGEKATFNGCNAEIKDTYCVLDKNNCGHTLVDIEFTEDCDTNKKYRTGIASYDKKHYPVKIGYRKGEIKRISMTNSDLKHKVTDKKFTDDKFIAFKTENDGGYCKTDKTFCDCKIIKKGEKI